MAGRSVREEFEGCLEPTMDALYQTAFSLAGNASDAEDLVQEAVLKAFRSFATFRRGSDFRAWILRVLANAFIDGYRHRKRVRPLEEEKLASQPAPPQGDLTLQDLEFLLADDVHQALQSLPAEQRLAVLLVDVNDLSNEEAAKVMGSPLGTLNSRLARGRLVLREALRSIAEKNRQVQRFRG